MTPEDTDSRGVREPRSESLAAEEGLANLERVWAPPRGWRVIFAVNNTYVGLWYLGAAIGFMVLAGILALVMRSQLAVPLNDLVSPQTYNRLFTMHGTVMMFLFAVPAVEAAAVYLLPGMLGARDLPFPRLSAYSFWAYAFGGTAFLCTLLFAVPPDGGRFMYPPLSGSGVLARAGGRPLAAGHRVHRDLGNRRRSGTAGRHPAHTRAGHAAQRTCRSSPGPCWSRPA
ncbi:MAG: cbb3-type cytochrome c oxidase subunit I [Betaproteobacteria bacterium]|nr:cbb3-type cytochrome c oxidase subunit I [Betaproteobacteria bacterium]